MSGKEDPPPPYNPQGYAPPPQQGGYAPPPQQGGYAPPPQQGGYAPPPQQGGHAPPPQGGYAPPPQHGGYAPPPQQGGYGPPPGSYPAQPTQPGGTTVVVAQPTVQATMIVSGATLGTHPCHTMCPTCRANVVTTTSHHIGGLAWLLCIIMCVVGLWLCCFIPFCVPDLQDVEHHCPNCKHLIGRNRRM